MLLLKALLLLVSVYELNAQKIVCYVTNWAQYRPDVGRFRPGDTPADLCTHLMYAFAKMSNNQLAMYEWNDDVLYAETMALKKQNPNLKVILAIGGWNMGSTDFSNMVTSDANMDLFVRTSVTFLQQYGFDGLDLDWEYPGVGVGSRPTDKARFTELCRRLSAAYKPLGLLLTAAVAAGQGTIDTAYDIRGIEPYLDFLNVMTYDYHGSWDNKVGANAPLYPHPSQNNQNFNCDFTLRYYISNGFPASKVIMGLGTYGRSMRLASANNHALGSAATGAGSAGTWTRESGFLSYYEICQKLSQGWIRNYDTYTQTPYAYQNIEWVSYDDEVSLKEKVDYIKNNGLGGAMFWAVDLDDFSGSFCGKGRYPLINMVKASLTGGVLPTSGATTTTTRPIDTTTTNGGGGATTTTTPGNISCPQPNGHFPYPGDCDKFINCANGIPHIISCPAGLHFNVNTGNCDWPDYANCASEK